MAAQSTDAAEKPVDASWEAERYALRAVACAPRAHDSAVATDAVAGDRDADSAIARSRAAQRR